MQDDSSPYNQFRYSIRTPLTRKYYERRIKKFFDSIEFGSLICQIVLALRRIKDVLLIISSRFGDDGIVVPTLPKLIEVRDKKEFDATKLNLSVYNNSKMKRVPLTENELNGVPP
jgi:hypothetical protein